MKRGKYRKGVFIVIYRKVNDEIKYLILKRKLHWKGWEFPKGGCKKAETGKKCVAREVKEETGQKPMKIQKQNKSGKYKYSRKLSDREGAIGQTYALYSVEIKSKKIRFDKTEHSGYKWVSFNQANKMLKWPNQKACLRIVDKSLI